jgi:hypothetical protein
MTPEQVEGLTMQAWMSLSEREQIEIVSRYTGKPFATPGRYPACRCGQCAACRRREHRADVRAEKRRGR